MTKELGNDNDQECFFGGGGLFVGGCSLLIVCQAKLYLSLEWFQNGFKLS